MCSSDLSHGAARIAMLGLGHTAAYSVGTIVLAIGIVRRTGAPLWPPVLARIIAVGVTAGVLVWLAAGAILPDDPRKIADAAVVAALGLIGAGLVLAGYRITGVRQALTTRESVPGPAAAPVDAEVLA